MEENLYKNNIEYNKENLKCANKCAVKHGQLTDVQMDILNYAFQKGYEHGKMEQLFDEPYSETVRRCLRDFDFDKVHEYMKSANWEWSIGDEFRVPTIIDLYQLAEKLLMGLDGEDVITSSTGGFYAYRQGDSIELIFALTSMYIESNKRPQS